MQALTLFELNALVRQTIECTLDREYWVEAELSECRESRGHCYMELIQYESPYQSPPKVEASNLSYDLPLGGRKVGAVPIARAQAKCWRSQWLMLQPMFERATGQQLHVGMKVRLKVYAQFHEALCSSYLSTH